MDDHFLVGGLKFLGGGNSGMGALRARLLILILPDLMGILLEDLPDFNFFLDFLLALGLVMVLGLKA
eukprot:CAMPEP_0196211986 /NCGR_PEP_ID=MMETSP0912-20130531/19567_1 /TAXON_ID=49265 /ORGANISM="Thalassiosira rotula, Strain GSO102" /LENGTH=66 /DNA_ID=CAMNT_0041487739 /DNA_START=20 /DNA_END=217 /DNA_ORIENTATION=+